MTAMAAVLLGMAAAPPEPPPDRPLAVPTRDVDVVYRTLPSGGDAPMQQRVRWDVAAGRQRVDPPVAGIYLILDYRTQHLFSVRDSIRTVLEIDGDRARTTPALAGGHYAGVGQATVAGLDCTVWQPDDPATPPRRVCVTGDGVLLRVAAGERVLIEAVSVRYGPADPAAFAVPAGYRRILPAQDAAPSMPTQEKAP